MLFEYFLGFSEAGALSLDNLVDIYYTFKSSTNTNVLTPIARKTLKRNIYKKLWIHYVKHRYIS